MHLEIILSNQLTENVDKNVIKKLYDLTYENEYGVVSPLDSTSVISGKIHTTAAYENLLEYLNVLRNEEGHFKTLLLVTSTQLYIPFADKNVEQTLIDNGIGDGVGITNQDAATARLGTMFVLNTDITSFDEFSKFTYANLNGGYNFWDCKNLHSIDLSNCKILPETTYINGNGNKGAFLSTGLVTIEDLGTIVKIPAQCFLYCNNLTHVSFPPTCKRIDHHVFDECPNLTISQEDLQYIEDLGWSGSDRDSGVFGTTANRAVYSSETVNLPNLISLGDAVFKNQTAIKSVNLPNLLNLSGMRTFENDNLIEEVSIGIKDNGDGTFTHTNLNVTSGESYSVGRMFGGCSSLKTVHMSKNMTMISFAMFIGCDSLDNIDIDFSNIRTLYGLAFNNCSRIGSGTGSKVMNFAKITLFTGGYKTVFGGNKSSLHVYFPKLSTISSASGLRRYNCLLNLFINIDWGGSFKLNTLYLRDIQEIGRGSFYKFAVNTSYVEIETLIINNETIPSMPDVTSSETITDVTNFGEDINNVSPFLRLVIGSIYVPDSKVEDYKNSALFAGIDISIIKPLSLCPRITVELANAGETGVIEEYM